MSSEESVGDSTEGEGVSANGTPSGAGGLTVSGAGCGVGVSAIGKPGGGVCSVDSEGLGVSDGIGVAMGNPGNGSGDGDVGGSISGDGVAANGSPGCDVIMGSDDGSGSPELTSGHPTNGMEPAITAFRDVHDTPASGSEAQTSFGKPGQSSHDVHDCSTFGIHISN